VVFKSFCLPAICIFFFLPASSQQRVLNSANDTVTIDIPELKYHFAVKLSTMKPDFEIGVGPVSRLFRQRIGTGTDSVLLTYRENEFEYVPVTSGKDTFRLKIHYLPAARDRVLYQQAGYLMSHNEGARAVDLYRQVTEVSKRVSLTSGSYYNIACYYALKGNRKKAFEYLEKSIDNGYKDFRNMANDSDLERLRSDKKYAKLYAKMMEKVDMMSDPENVQVVTTDIHHFWEAFDKAAKDSMHRKEIFQEYYFGKASPGLEDYFDSKIQSVDQFIKNQQAKPKFYAAIRENTLYVDKLKDSIRICFRNMKALYPESLFPNIYFMIGRWSSAGTVSSNGLLIGLDQYAGGEGIPVHELNEWERRNLKEVRSVPALVSHELIHYIQSKRDDTTLLSSALAEGMADFIGEKISGVNVSKWLHEFANKLEVEIWNEFKKEMWLNRYSNWIGNGSRETAERPADLGYYIGYKICEAYYNKAADKKQATKDILEIKDAKKFWEKSGYDPR
jgi:hypothetical protein